MTLIIRLNSTGTHADVSHGGEGDADGAHRLQPDTSYFAIPYDRWMSYAGRSVDVVALQHRVLREDREAGAASGTAAPEPGLAEWRGLLRPPSSLGEAILVHGILGFGIPATVLLTLFRELLAPGYDPARFQSGLLIRLVLWGLIMGPVYGAYTWRRARRAGAGG
jgi:hypothetical protein